VKLSYFQGQEPNFGDELNTWLWPQLLPGFFDDDPGILFLGIGSILGFPYSPDAKKVVFGAGYVPSYSDHAPNLNGEDWAVFFVRGPRTARSLGLPESLGIGDAAILLRALDGQLQRQPRHIGFMPHWESMSRGNWRRACALAGIRLIDPTAPVGSILTDILGCERLITEAMHGAIVADTLRVPWVPVLPIHPIHRDKWLDWADALRLDFLRHRLWPSSSAEVILATRERPLLASVGAAFGKGPFSRLSQPLLLYAAAQRLAALAKEEPCLSADPHLESACEQILEKLRQFEALYRR
jgi:succinoglycan biosynthesis protein ExoV